MFCRVCKREFSPKKANQQYCGPHCRRKIEVKRRRWDYRNEYISQVQKFCDKPTTSDEQKKRWLPWVKAAKENLGARP